MSTSSQRAARRWVRRAGCFALGLCALACGSDPDRLAPPAPSGFRRVELTAEVGEPVSLAVLPDGRVLHGERQGRIWAYDPASEGHAVVAEIPVYSHDEDGLQGIAIGPDFDATGWVYVYYSPPLDTPLDDPATTGVDEGTAPFDGTSEIWAVFAGHQRLSRFRFDGAALALDSEQILLEVPVDRGLCCHVGGQIDFDADGLLYLSTGDDTNPFESGGFSPLDERDTRHPGLDAQRSAANTNDLRGKLLRIRVAEDGSYSVPDGNLFAPGTEGTRPEVYVMGLRNPFRFAVDRQRGWVYLADYSPDAGSPRADRGPAGQGKWTVVREASNYGWPYCATDALPYVDYDFATGESGGAFDCAEPRNESPRNTGLVELPPVAAPQIWYSYARSARFPELGSGGIAPMAGPAYVYDPERVSDIQWPEELDGLPLLYEWSRDFVRELHLDADGNFVSFGDRLRGVRLDNAVDMEFGPDGALYVLEYGDGYYRANPDAALSRIEYTPPEP